jgi:cytochrome c5
VFIRLRRAAILARLQIPTSSGDAVSVAQDKKFFDTFMLVLGTLILLAVGLWITARIISANTQEQYVQLEPSVKAAVNERIEPVAKLAVAGKDNSALEPQKAAAAGAGPAAATADLSGEEVFNSACVACHGAGVAGAPKKGDKGAWGPRIAKGIQTLHDHALHGFQGNSGVMPPKGGRVDLSDKSIMNAVDYMVAAAK